MEVICGDERVILVASTGVGKAAGFTVGGLHGPGLIVSHHSRARSDHRQLWFRQFNSQTGYARKHLQHSPLSSPHSHSYYSSSIIHDRKRVQWFPPPRSLCYLSELSIHSVVAASSKTMTWEVCHAKHIIRRHRFGACQAKVKTITWSFLFYSDL